MNAGQTFTIEPMVNAGVWRDRMWPDGWTAVTADGKRSAQFEHTLLVIVSSVWPLVNVINAGFEYLSSKQESCILILA
ncbi:Microtubule-associated protein 1A [Turnera subulata]|uniref:Microtubule-associated protein 1A n=1 Tax=Turnera subulata TaxID=218843 RepID=A0A9Q0JJF2_9ROSI|nr:Microtubule-associated protein 1A [Turnera subulata]